ncbi:hypothetical protein DEU56DRAFT_842224 [Suillus clintonianus]|uniref:uncharacterized protein n=1 Tax=Suillus clintonianus TaxID=1904413 RepID=UPI001B8719FF|nr:uncharacterized protein DEU56DRAFT_842224 [Suillus clintonianus]KAG2113698.1 hypothetical protein DEU56DRAFT_842224 [Suillus clintonianus]
MNPATQKRVADDLEDSEDREVKRVKMDPSAIKNDPDFTLDPELDKKKRQKYKCLFDGESILPSSYARHIRSRKHNDAKEKSKSCPVRSPIPDAFQEHFAEHAGQRDGGAQSSSMYSGPATPNTTENVQISSTETAEDFDLSSTFTETEDLNLDHFLDMGIGADLPLEGDIVDITAASMSSDFMTTGVPVLPPADEVSSSSDDVPPASYSSIYFDFDFNDEI